MTSSSNSPFQGSYLYLGILLVAFGVAISIPSYVFAKNTGLLALGLATIILGIVAVSLPRTLSASAAMETIFVGAIYSTEKELERFFPVEKNDKGRVHIYPDSSVVDSPLSEHHQTAANLESSQQWPAVYLPPRDGIGTVYLSVSNEMATKLDLDAMQGAPFASSLSSLSLENVGGVRVTPVGVTLSQIPEVRGGSSTEEALDFILVETTQVCSSLNVSEVEDVVVVEMAGVKIRTPPGAYYNLLGSIPASLAASTISSTRGKPVIILDELDTQGRKLVRFRVLPAETE